jgi:hypothetical protein
MYYITERLTSGNLDGTDWTAFCLFEALTVTHRERERRAMGGFAHRSLAKPPFVQSGEAKMTSPLTHGCKNPREKQKR